MIRSNHDLKRKTSGALAFLLASLSALQFNLANAQQINIESAKLKLNAAACGVENASWTQSSGPTSAEILGSGPDTYALVSEQGDYEFELSCCVASTGDGDTDRIQRLLSSPDRIGYGAQTTGGAAAESYTMVTSVKDSGPGTLREALRASGPRWIVFDESIHGQSILLESSVEIPNPDVTIDGAGAGITISSKNGEQIPLLVFRGGNTIIHGITMNGANKKIISLMMREGDDYWVDHVTVTGNVRDDAISIGQGTKATSANNITISNYKVFNTTYGLLSGGVDSEDHPPHRVTIHSSDLAGTDRNPFIKNNGLAHVFNNYVHDWRFTATRAGSSSKIYSENNVYSANAADNPNNALVGLALGASNVAGIVYTKGNLMLDGAGSRGDVQSVTSDPINLPYSYTPMDSSEVKTHVLANAGADKVNLNNSFCQTYTEKYSYAPR